MSTLLEAAGKGTMRDEFRAVASDENKDPDEIMLGVACGEIVITKNNKHDLPTILGIGAGLRIKVNANIGTSQDRVDLDEEWQR